MSDDIVNLPVDPSNGSAGSPGESGAAGDSAGAEAQSPSFKALMEEARKLEPGDDTGVIALLVKAAALHLSEIQADFLLKAIRTATGMGLKTLRKTWAFWQGEIKKREDEAGKEERERTAADWAAEAAKARAQFKQRMFESCRHIAEDPAPARPDGGGRARARRRGRGREHPPNFSDLRLSSPRRRSRCACSGSGRRRAARIWWSKKC